MSEVKNKGAFLVFEGIDGSGKSTQIKMLMDNIQAAGAKCIETREPSDGPIGVMIRQVLSGRMSMDYKVLAQLFAADRLDHLVNGVNGICEQIDNGVTVVSDRYYFSSYAYHGVDVPMDWVIQANAISAQTLRPTYTIFIDISPEEAMRRITQNRTNTELFETHERLTQVREMFMEAFERLKDEEQVLIVNGDQAPEEVAAEIWAKVSGIFE